jgi:hypothetical protein
VTPVGIGRGSMETPRQATRYNRLGAVYLLVGRGIYSSNE